MSWKDRAKNIKVNSVFKKDIIQDVIPKGYSECSLFDMTKANKLGNFEIKLGEMLSKFLRSAYSVGTEMEINSAMFGLIVESKRNDELPDWFPEDYLYNALDINGKLKIFVREKYQWIRIKYSEYLKECNV